MKIYFTILITLMFLISCKEKIEQVNAPDYSENYKYFPIKAGREWLYESTSFDNTSGRHDTFAEHAKYNDTNFRTDFYRNGQVFSNLYWSNSNNKLGCCVDVILLDYNQIGCSSDSVLIYNKESASLKQTIYQYCSKLNAPDVPNYKTINCLKTRQVNLFSSGKMLTITQYFGFGVGLIYREETNLDKNGKVITIEKKILVSHNF